MSVRGQFVAVGLLAGMVATQGLAQTQPPPSAPSSHLQPRAPQTFTVPAGTKVLLSLKSGINTKTAQQGDGVYLVSSFPVVGNSRVMIPVGVYVQGVVDRVQRPGRVKGRAQLDLHFTTMIFPNGQVVEVPGVLNSLPGSDGPKVKGSEGTVEQAGNKGRDVGNVLKGAAIGAEGGVIGGAATGDVAKGVGYGSLAGAAAGTIYTLFTRGNDIVIPSGTSVEMVLQRPLVLQESQLAGMRRSARAGADGSCQPAAANGEAEAANSVPVRKPGLQLMNPEEQERGPSRGPGTQFLAVGPRHAVFSRRLFFHHHFSLSAGKGRGHQHVASPGRSGPAVHQQVRVSL